MLIKLLKYILVTFLFLSCTKYEEGPKISLLSKEKRLAREWKIEYSVNLSTGIEHSADFYNWILKINKDGTFERIILYNLVQSTYSGTWNFVGNNQIRFNFQDATGENNDFYTILRLSRKELWVKDLQEEIHYYAD